MVLRAQAMSIKTAKEMSTSVQRTMETNLSQLKNRKSASEIGAELYKIGPKKLDIYLHCLIGII